MRLPIYGGEEGQKISPSPPSAAAAAAARELASYNPISLGPPSECEGGGERREIGCLGKLFSVSVGKEGRGVGRGWRLYCAGVEER